MDPDFDFGEVHWRARASVFEAMVDEASLTDRVFTIARDGKPLAVIVGVDHLEALRAPANAASTDGAK